MSSSQYDPRCEECGCLYCGCSKVEMPAASGEPATVSDLLRRSRNLLSHPPLWWQENEASRERLIGQLDAALHDTAQPAPAPSDTVPALLYLALAGAMGYKAGEQELSPEEFAANLRTAAQPAPARVPLTDEQIDSIGRTSHGGNDPQEWFRNATRAIEAAHGIRSKT